MPCFGCHGLIWEAWLHFTLPTLSLPGLPHVSLRRLVTLVLWAGPAQVLKTSMLRDASTRLDNPLWCSVCLTGLFIFPYLQPEPLQSQLMPLVSAPATRHCWEEPVPIPVIPSHRHQAVLLGAPKPSLVRAEPALAPHTLLTGRVLQPHCIRGLS